MPSAAGEARPVAPGEKIHVIQKGDTLISIALANGLDYRELAIWNNIDNPNVIKLLLPESKQSQTLDKQQVLLQVTADHQYYIDQTMVPQADLKGALLDKTAGMDKPTIVLRFDKELTVQDLVDVLQVGTEIKVKMILATKNGA